MPEVPQEVRTILTQGGKEMPGIPQRPKGRRGRIAESVAHNLYENLLKHEDSVLRFMSDPDVSFASNASEQEIRVSYQRPEHLTHYWDFQNDPPRISSFSNREWATVN